MFLPCNIMNLKSSLHINALPLMHATFSAHLILFDFNPSAPFLRYRFASTVIRYRVDCFLGCWAV